MKEVIILPCHPNARISDPLSIVNAPESPDGLVPYWEFLTALLEPCLYPEDETSSLISQFCDCINTISYSLYSKGSADLSTLFFFAPALTQEDRNSILSPSLVRGIVRHSLRMKELFPEWSLPTLSTTATGNAHATLSIALNRAQICCIVCHMLLGTLPPPSWPITWEGPNLGLVWFNAASNDGAHIKFDYVRVLLCYLQEMLETSHVIGQEKVIYRIFDLCNPHIATVATKIGEDMTNLGPPEEFLDSLLAGEKQKTMIPLHIVLLDEEDDDSHECFAADGPICQLVASNKEIGFGETGTKPLPYTHHQVIYMLSSDPGRTGIRCRPLPPSNSILCASSQLDTIPHCLRSYRGVCSL